MNKETPDLESLAKEFEREFLKSINKINKSYKETKTQNNGSANLGYVVQKLQSEGKIPLVYGVLKNGSDGVLIFSDPERMIKLHGVDVYKDLIGKLKDTYSRVVAPPMGHILENHKHNGVFVLEFTELQSPHGSTLGYLFKDGVQ